MDGVQELHVEIIDSEETYPSTSQQKYDVGYEVNILDEAMKYDVTQDFVQAFRGRMNSVQGVSTESLPELFATMNIVIDPSEIYTLAEATFGEREWLSLPEAVALVKDWMHRTNGPQFNGLAPSMQPVLIQSRSSRRINRLLGYFTLSEGSLVSGRKLLAFSVITLCIVGFSISGAAIGSATTNGISDTYLTLETNLKILKTGLKQVSKFLDGQTTAKLMESSNLVNALIQTYGLEIEEINAKAKIETIAGLTSAHFRQSHKLFMPAIFGHVQFLKNLVDEDVGGDASKVDESHIISRYLPKLKNVNSEYLYFHDMFVECANSGRNSSVKSVDRTVVDKSLNLSTQLAPNSYISLLSNGSYSPLDAFYNCIECRMIAIPTAIRNTSCTMGIVLHLDPIRETLRNGAIEMVKEANAYLNGTELLMVQSVNNSYYKLLNPSIYCQFNCSVYPGNDAYKLFNSSNLSYGRINNTAVLGSVKSNSLLGIKVVSSVPLFSLIQDATNNLIYMANHLQNATSISSIDFVLYESSTSTSVPQYLTDFPQDIPIKMNQTSFAWYDGSSRQMSAPTSQKIFGSVIVVIVTQTANITDALLEGVTSSMVSSFNAVTPESIDAIITLQKSTSAWKLLSNVSCGKCNMLLDKMVLQSQTLSTRQRHTGTDYNGTPVVYFTDKTTAPYVMGLVVKQTKTSIDKKIQQFVTPVLISSLVLVFVGGLLMLLVVFLIIRQVKNLIVNRSVMQSRLSKLDGVLENMFPKSIKERMLKDGHMLEVVGGMSVAFLDIHSFTPIANVLTAKQLQTLLSYVFRVMDEVAGHYGVNKVKTIGDCYLAVCGLQGEVIYKDDPVLAMFSFVMNSLLIFSQNFTHNPEIGEIFTIVRQVLLDTKSRSSQFALRAGMASGNVLCGILPGKVPSFDVWGPIINLASRLESNGTPGSLMLSESVYKVLARSEIFGSIKLEGPQSVYCKGFGAVKAYTLHTSEVEVPKDLRVSLGLEVHFQRHNYLQFVGDGKRSESLDRHSDSGSDGEQTGQKSDRRSDRRSDRSSEK